jgi:tRNA A-37 threonylcarbamoyl transferase component Bud32
MLQDVGNAIPDDTPINETIRTGMRLALSRIHQAGFIHGDVERRNFCIDGSGHVYLVDLEWAAVGSEVQTGQKWGRLMNCKKAVD